MKKTLPLLALSMVCLSGPAFAATLPNIDIVASCKEVASFAGGSAQIELQCRKDEKAAKARLENMQTSARAWNSCMDVGEMSGSFAIFEQCLKDETAAEKALEE